MAVIGISFYTVNQRQNNRHSGVVPFQKQKTTSTRKRNVRKNTILDLDEEERIIQSSISFNEDGTTDTSIPTSIDEFHSTTTTSTTTFPFVSSFNLNSLQHILDIIVPKDDLSKQYNQPLPHIDIKEIDFVTPMEGKDSVISDCYYLDFIWTYSKLFISLSFFAVVSLCYCLFLLCFRFYLLTRCRNNLLWCGCTGIKYIWTTFKICW